MENKATTKTPIPTRSGFPLLSSASRILSPVFYLLCVLWDLCGLKPFLQNKAKVKMGKMNISTAIIKAYANEQRTMSDEHYPKQTQIKANFKRRSSLPRLPDKRLPQ